MVLGIIDFGLLFQRYEVLTNAAREGARISTLPEYGGVNLEANVTSRVNQYLVAADLDPDVANVSVVPGTILIDGNDVCVFRVEVTYPHDYSFVGGIINFFGGTLDPRELVARSAMRPETVAGSCPP